MLCRHELITIVTPLSRPGSAKTAASVCLYSVYRKQERSLFTAALEQTSNVPTAIIRRRACGLPYPASSWQSRLSVALHVCFFDRCATAPETRPLPAVSRAHPPATSTDCPAVSDGGGGEAVIPRHVVRGPMAAALPRSRSPRTLPPDRFGRATAGYVDVRRRRWGPVIGREWRRVRPVTPPSRPHRQSNSVHAGKSTYSGEIDYRFLTFQTGSRF